MTRLFELTHALTQHSTRSDPSGNGFGFQVLLEARESHFPADAGLLVSAERHVGRVPDTPVDVDRADTHPRRDVSGTVGIARETRARQSVRRIVGDSHSVVVAVVRDHRQHRAEDLLTRDVGVVVEARKDGRLDEEAGIAVRGPATARRAWVSLCNTRIQVLLTP